eukprot:947099-Rhodomonas_salina.1
MVQVYVVVRNHVAVDARQEVALPDLVREHRAAAHGQPHNLQSASGEFTQLDSAAVVVRQGRARRVGDLRLRLHRLGCPQELVRLHLQRSTCTPPRRISLDRSWQSSHGWCASLKLRFVPR